MRVLRSLGTLGLAVQLSLFPLCGDLAALSRGSAPAHPHATAPSQAQPVTPPAGLVAALERQEYQASRSARGLQAPNRAQDLRVYFEPDGVRLHDRAASGEPQLAELSLLGMGRGASLAAVPSGDVQSAGARVEIRRAGLVEWYENRPEGLEQGFDLAARPAGAGELRLALAVRSAQARDSGMGVVLASAQGRRLEYGGLSVRDSHGASIPARLEAPAADRIEIVVDDRQAVYPLQVDPLITSTRDTLLVGAQAGAHLGWSVAGAGDVNGDGYADVIVGAPEYDPGDGVAAGAVFIFLGGSNGLADGAASGSSAGASAMIQTHQGGAQLGYSVAGAGDVNGDGYGDVIVGAPGWAGLGAAFVLLGGPGGIPGGELSGLNPMIVSDQAGARLGSSVAGAGDVNADGYADLIVGAPSYDVSQTDEGAAFVFLGRAGAAPGGTAATAATRLVSGQAQAHLGQSVAGAGDVNGDGYADVIVGAPTYDAGQTDEGAAFVFLGGAAGIPSGNPGSASTTLQSNQAGALLGWSVAGAGDVNGDGHADAIVGAHDYAGQASEGAAFVFLGGPSGLANGDPTTASATLAMQQAGATVTSVAGAGDVNGDGYADVIVGSSDHPGHTLHEGAAFVFLGGATGVGSAAAAQAYARLGSAQVASAMGLSVAGAGDVNGDGYADVIAGAPSYEDSRTDEGAAFVYLGGPATTLGQDGWATFGSYNEGIGFNIAGAGDVNGDGFADVIVGSPDQWHATEGAAFIFLGGPSGIGGPSPGTIVTPATILRSDQLGAQFGASVAGAGDVNGDGYADVIVGAGDYDAGQQDEGAAFVFLGGPAGIASGTAATAHAILQSDQAGAHLGGRTRCCSGGGTTSVAAAGDVNGDGYADVIVGAGDYDGAQQDEGAAFIFLGGPAGIASGSPATASAILRSDQAGARLGGNVDWAQEGSVAGAGDVNGDGYADVIVGAGRYDTTLADAGAAFVFLGGPSGVSSGTPATASAAILGQHMGALVGSCVAGAGDVNGDGFADVIVGSTQGTATYVFHGGPLGVVGGSTSAATTTLPPSGLGVASAGDVNGDGYGDVIVSNADWPWAMYLFLGGPAGLSTVEAFVTAFDAVPHAPVAGAGDVNGDGYADVIAGRVSWRAVQVFLGNGGRLGRPLRTGQLGPSGGANTPLQPWDLSLSSSGFRVRMNATSPTGRGTKAKLEAEVCDPGVPFGSASCSHHLSPDWTDLGTSGQLLTLDVNLPTGSAATLHRWRARVLRVPTGAGSNGVGVPQHPEHGPWRRLDGQSREADVRTFSSVPYLTDIRATVTDNQASVVPGRQTTYTVQVTNLGPAAAYNLRVRNLPTAHLDYVNWTCSGPVRSGCPASGSNLFDHRIRHLDAGQTVTYTVRGTVPSGALQDLEYTVSALVPGGSNDPDFLNNTATDVDTLTPQADLRLRLSEGADPMPVYGSNTYDLTVTNQGPSDAADGRLTGQLPGGLEIVSASPSVGSCQTTTLDLTCSLGGLPAGDAATITVTATSDGHVLGPLQTWAQVYNPLTVDPDLANNLVTELTTVRFVKGDLNNDLQTDLVLRHLPSPDHEAWLMRGTERVGQAAITPTPPSSGWELAGVDDFDGDHRNDLVLWNKALQQVEFWVMGGPDNTQRQGAPFALKGAVPPAGDWRLAATADFNSDGHPDLVWNDVVKGDVEIWLLGSNQALWYKVTKVLRPTPSRQPGWRVVAARDFDGDGRPDLLWYDPATGKVLLWTLGANLARTGGDLLQPDNAGGPDWEVLAAGDYDPSPSGAPTPNDIVWRNSQTGELLVWHLDGAGKLDHSKVPDPDQPVDPLDWTLAGPR